jgi:hypothetical protein
VLQGLVTLGCSYEGANARYVVVNIPPGIDLGTVCDYLVSRNAAWEHADPTYSELHPNDA